MDTLTPSPDVVAAEPTPERTMHTIRVDRGALTASLPRGDDWLTVEVLAWPLGGSPLVRLPNGSIVTAHYWHPEDVGVMVKIKAERDAAMRARVLGSLTDDR